MRKKIIILICWLLGHYGWSFAQTPTKEPDYESLLNTLTNEAQEAQYDGRYQTAIRKWNQCLTIYEQLGDSLNQAVTKVNVGKLYSRVGDYPQAFQLLEDARAIYTRLNARFDLLQAIKIQARINFSIGNYYSAKSLFEEGLELAEKLKTTSEVNQFLTNLGQTYYQLGDDFQARKLYYQTLNNVRQREAAWWEARLLSFLGILNFYESNLDSSLIQFNEAVRIQKEISDQNGLKDNYFNLGIVYFSLDQLRKAASALTDALVLQKELADSKGQIDTELRLGDIAYQQLNFKAAETWYETAYQHAQQSGHRKQLADCLKKKGFLEFSNNRFLQADKYLKEALAIALNIDDPTLLWTIYQGLGLVAKAQKLTSDAFQNFQQAIGYIQLSEPQKHYITQATEFVKSESDVYYEAMLAAYQQAERFKSTEWISRLFEISENLQARQLFYELNTLTVQPQASEIAQNIIAIRSYARQYWTLKKLLIEEKTKALLQQNLSRVITLRNYLQNIESTRQQLLDEMYRQHPRYQSLFSTARPTLTQVQEGLRTKQILLKYMVLDDLTLIITVQHDTLGIRTSTVSKKELLNQLNNFHQNIQAMHRQHSETNQAQDPERELIQILDKLSQYLLAPVQSIIANADEMIILADPLLQGFPFEALYWTGTKNKTRFLIDQIPIHYHNHSALVFNQAYLPPPAQADFIQLLTATGSPLIPDNRTGRDQRTWRAVYPLVNPEWLTLSKQLEQSQGVFHISIPGLWNSRRMNDSYFNAPLTPDETNWYLADWFKIKLHSSLLTCIANLHITPALNSPGEAVFSEVLKIIGARDQLFSRWHTPEAVQQEFFNIFYANILNDISPLVALQRTKQAFIKNNKFQHPYFWSAFVLYEY